MPLASRLQPRRKAGTSISSSETCSSRRSRSPSPLTPRRRARSRTWIGRRARVSKPSKPVAITVTLTSSDIVGSITVPKMMLAPLSAVATTMSAASLTSNRLRSSEPVKLSSIPVAPSIDSSISGEEMAIFAASAARFSPEAAPTPIIAEPASDITARTSAKSRLIWPGVVIRSVMPCTPWRRMSSAIRNASLTEVWRSTTWSSFSFGTMIRVSTLARSLSIPSRACCMRRLPSNSNGLVITPTVSAPISSLAISAITGAAPVPVPPPSPAVTKTMSAPFSASLMSSRLSAAAPPPISGLAPAPSPLVSWWPIESLMSASQACRA